MPERRIDTYTAQWTTQALARLMCTFAIVQGVTIIVTGDERWASRSYATAMAVPGAPESWGYVLAGVGVTGLCASLLGRVTAVVLPLFLGGVWCAFFALAFARAAATYPEASVSAAWSYLVFTAAFWTLCIAYHRSRA